MRLSRGLPALTAAMLMFPNGFMIIRAHPAGALGGSQAPAKAETKAPAPQAAPAAGRPATIQGNTIDEWLAALKAPEPKVRERAVEVLGERALDPAVPQDERSRLGSAISGLIFSDKDADVRQAAAFFADLGRIAGDPERVKRAVEERKRIIKPTTVPIRLVDAQGRPVAGAVASSFFWKDADHEPSFTPGDPNDAATADARGELALKLEVPGHLDAAAVYAMQRDGVGPTSACDG
jgi:hypothetical protein